MTHPSAHHPNAVRPGEPSDYSLLSAAWRGASSSSCIWLTRFHTVQEVFIMRIGNVRWGWRHAAGLLGLLLLILLLASGGRAGAAPAGPRVLSNEVVPAAVRDGSAHAVGVHA